MTQIGLNLGARHARTFGHGVSFTKNLDDETKKEHDGDIIGGVSLFWALANSALPSEVMDTVKDYLRKEQLPFLATRNVPPGM